MKEVLGMFEGTQCKDCKKRFDAEGNIRCNNVLMKNDKYFETVCPNYVKLEEKELCVLDELKQKECEKCPYNKDNKITATASCLSCKYHKAIEDVREKCYTIMKERAKKFQKSGGLKQLAGSVEG